MSADAIDSTIEYTTEAAPTDLADIKPKMQLTGTVKRLELYGAFIDLGLETTGLIHISKLGEEQVNRVSDVLKEGDEVTVWVEKVDPERQQIMLTMVPPLAVDWSDLKTDQVYTGTITRLENFGAFVDIGAEREGLVHISELSHDYVKNAADVVKIGSEVEVKVLGFNRRKRRIDLSMKALTEKTEEDFAPPPTQAQGGRNQRRSEPREREVEVFEEETEDMPTAMEIALRRALGNETIAAVKTESGSQPKKNKKQQREEKRRIQEDLLKRTLTMQSDN
ncbi:MAG: S1 RNA-binding domain-containing protein [Chloroflexota bacterium]|jgi:small subunit ribosomal protein S1